MHANIENNFRYQAIYKINVSPFPYMGISGRVYFLLIGSKFNKTYILHIQCICCMKALSIMSQRCI